MTWGGDLLSAGHKAVLLVERSPRFLTLLTDRISHKAGQEFEIWSSFVPSFLPFSSLFISGQVPLGLFADQSIFKFSKTPFEQVGNVCWFFCGCVLTWLDSYSPFSPFAGLSHFLS